VLWDAIAASSSSNLTEGEIGAGSGHIDVVVAGGRGSALADSMKKLGGCSVTPSSAAKFDWSVGIFATTVIQSGLAANAAAKQVFFCWARLSDYRPKCALLVRGKETSIKGMP
jgi:hypothetical protein